MRRSQHRAGTFLVAAFLLARATPAGAVWEQIQTSVDLNYTYEQIHREGNVNAKTGFQQKYQIQLKSTLSSSFDFAAAIAVDLDNQWASDAATTSKISPTLDLAVAGPQSAVKFSYKGTIDDTDEYRETSGSTKYSNTYDLDVDLTPTALPELKLRFQEKHDYEEATNDTTGRTLEMQLRDEFYDLNWEFTLKLDKTVDTLPEEAESNTTDWAARAAYKRVIFYDVDFEAAYEIKETYTEDTNRGAFTSSSETYVQSLKTRLKKSLQLTPLLNVGASWEYNVDQDLEELDYDYKFQNKYSLDARMDVLPSLKVSGEARRETEHVNAVAGEDDTSKVTDTLKGAFDYEPAYWLRFGGKAERKWQRSIDATTGGSEDRTDDEQYELTMKHKWGDFWELTASTSTTSSYTEGVLQDREAKFRSDLVLKVVDYDYLSVGLAPSYESSRAESWDELGKPSGETSTSDARIKLEAKALLLRDLLKVTFSHEYGQKITHETDEVANYTRTLDYNEDTKLNLASDDLIQDLHLEYEIERKADDTEDDSEPQVVEVSHSFKLDWQYEELALASALKYTNKGQDPDTLDFTAKVGWKGERVDLAGDYQFTKTYADRTDEDRKLNLKFSYKF